MGPNVTRLFEECNDMSGYFHSAHERRAMLFANHGEALIEALEVNVKVLERYASLFDNAELIALDSTEALLSTLEQEAQP